MLLRDLLSHIPVDFLLFRLECISFVLLLLLLGILLFFLSFCLLLFLNSSFFLFLLGEIFRICDLHIVFIWHFQVLSVLHETLEKADQDLFLLDLEPVAFDDGVELLPR